MNSKAWRWTAAVALAGLLAAGCGKNVKQAPVAGASEEPDRALWNTAQQDLKDHKYTIARLTLQTLINTYPDSEFLAKAKLAIADSFYVEGGTAGLAQAVAEYKDFITFFPFLEEAAYAQLQVGRAHYRRMEKPDRDRTQARLAEQELQTFLANYPNHKLTPEAEQRLREVQEVLAEGDYRVGRFYYLKDTPRARVAAIMRLSDMVDRYPLYSQADKALWMLADSLHKNEYSQAAGVYFTRLVRDYPLSPLVDEAKERLQKLGVPVPQPDPAALERMQKERERQKERPGFLRRSLGIMRSGPDVSAAAHEGQPNLTPQSEGPSETLKAAVGFNTVTPAPPTSVVVPTTPGGNSGTPPAASSSASGPGQSAVPGADPKRDSRKEAEEKRQKDEKESSSKKKKGLRKIIPW
jgi:outer membrane protein assembly factor BamD